MDTPFVKELESHFVSTEDFAASYSFIIEGIKKPLYVAIENGELEIHYGQEEKIDVVAKLSRDVLQSIIDGRMTFQRAFMTGEMTAKGNFKTLRMLDQIFVFRRQKMKDDNCIFVNWQTEIFRPIRSMKMRISV